MQSFGASANAQAHPSKLCGLYPLQGDHGRFDGAFDWGGLDGQEGLDNRHRDTTGRIDKKHGNTRIGSLRKTYGDHFAEGRRKDMMLKTLLAETGTESLHTYLRKYHK